MLSSNNLPWSPALQKKMSVVQPLEQTVILLNRFPRTDSKYINSLVVGGSIKMGKYLKDHKSIIFSLNPGKSEEHFSCLANIHIYCDRLSCTTPKQPEINSTTIGKQPVSAKDD